MQTVIGCGRRISGIAKNHIKTNIIGWQCVVECYILHVTMLHCYMLQCYTHVTSGTTKTVVPKIPKNSGSTPTLCLDKAVLAQGEGGVQKVVDFANPPRFST